MLFAEFLLLGIHSKFKHFFGYFANLHATLYTK